MPKYRRLIAVLVASAAGLAAMMGSSPTASAAGPSSSEIGILFHVNGAAGPSGTILPVSGVKLQLTDGAGVAYDESWAFCTSDADGCQFIIPLGIAQGQGRAYGVKLVDGKDSTGTTWAMSDTMNTVANLPPGTLTGSSNYHGTSIYEEYSRVQPVVLTLPNPKLTSDCFHSGMNLAIVADLSSSMAGVGIDALQKASNAFVDQLMGTDSAIQLFTFSSDSPATGANNANRPLTPVNTEAGAAQVKAWINGWTPVGGTNWDAGLRAVADSGSDFDAVIFITDGKPNISVNGIVDDYASPQLTVDNTAAANAIKAAGARITAISVGDEFDISRLAEITGPTHNDPDLPNNDFFLTNWSNFSNVLLTLLHTSCQVANVVYVDDDNAGAIVAPAPDTVTTFRGNAGTAIGFTEAMAKAGVPDGYDFASLANIELFDDDPATDQTITVHLNQQLDVTTLDVPRVIQYRGAGDATPAEVVQAITWTVTTNLVTGAIWYSTDATGYDAVDTPEVPGFTADIVRVNAAPVASTPTQTMPQAQTVIVTYQPSGTDTDTTTPDEDTATDKDTAETGGFVVQGSWVPFGLIGAGLALSAGLIIWRRRLA